MLELDALDLHINAVWEWVNKTKTNTGLIKELPWFLVIGFSNTGKTTLILKSELQRAELQPFATLPDDEKNNDKHCNWWLTQNALFLDIAGHYFDNESHRISFEQLIQAIQKRFDRRFFQGIILTLEAKQWTASNKIKQRNQTKLCKHNLHTLIKQLKRHSCPVHLIITKLDEITGFTQFFADMDKQERESALGFLISNTSNLSTTFKKEFNKLLAQLYKRVILRLHQERNLKKRIYIQQFPTQMELLRNNLANFIYHLANTLSAYGKAPLRGIYFVSSLQSNTSQNFAKIRLAQILAAKEPATRSLLPLKMHYQKTYFLAKLFQEITANHAEQPSTFFNILQHNKRRFLLYLFSGLLTISALFFISHSFSEKIKFIHIAENKLTQYQLIIRQFPLGTVDLAQTLPALNLLRQSVTLIQAAHIPWLITRGFHQFNGVTLAKQTYQRALTDYFLPGISHLLEQTLMTETDPYVLYNVLKIYLMLSQPNHMDTVFIQDWLTQYWKQIFYSNPYLIQQLSTHLSTLFSSLITPIVPNSTVIERARSTLANLPTTQLAYAILKSNHESHWVNPFLSDKKSTKIFTRIFSNVDKIPGILQFYTATLFPTVYFQEIPQASFIAIHGNWVLGQTNRRDNEQILTKMTQIAYLQDYAKHWQALLNNFTLLKWETVAGLRAALKIITDKETSPLLCLLKITKENTDSAQLLSRFSKEATTADTHTIKIYLSDVFSPLSRLLIHNNLSHPSDIDRILSQLNALQIYISPMQGDNEENTHFFFEAAKKRYINPDSSDPFRVLFIETKDLPTPLKTWLNNIARNIWRVTLDNAQQYINHVWQMDVLSYYRKKMNDRYPLFKQSDAEIPLEDFKNFFAANGLLDYFFKKYLSPFIDTSQVEWRSRKVDGLSLSLSLRVLKEFKRAIIIRAMFFDQNQILSLNFSLYRIALGPNVKRLILIYSDQPYVDTANHSAKIHHLHWPSKNDSITLAFTNEENHTTTQTFTGAWALFRLLDKAQLQPTEDTRHFELTFDANGNAARYQLTTPQLVNPFVSGIIDLFRCPEKIN